VSAARAVAVDEYVAAVDLLLSANVGADAGLKWALGADPYFTLAHIARARLPQLQARIGEARVAAADNRHKAGLAFGLEHQNAPRASRRQA
jgi:hypothetical protein